MYTYLILAAALVSSVSAYPIIECLGIPPPTRINIEGCPNTPCNVTQGSYITFDSDFEAIDDSTTLTLEILRTAFGYTDTVPLPSELANACYGLVNADCPVSAFDLLTHGATIPMFSEYQGGVPVYLQVRILLDGEIPTVCAQIELRFY